MNTIPQKELSVFDSTCIIVGIIIGAGIYETSPLVASSMGSVTGTIGIWIIGGMLAFCGSLCYSELASAYPYQGGDTIYLSRAYGPAAGYLFGFSQITIIRPGDIALMAFIFGRYASQLVPFAHSQIIYALSAVLGSTFINAVGVRQSKWLQNGLTVVKVAGIGLIIIAAMLADNTEAELTPQLVEGSSFAGWQLALILVLYTFGGWNEMAYVSAEVKNSQRNITRSLIAGTISVTVLYVLINAAFLFNLGYHGMIASKAVAVDTVRATFPHSAGKLISVLICISTLGAINGLVFTGARIYYAVGQKYLLFRFLGKWHPKTHTPLGALLSQGAISIGIILLARSFMETILYTAPAVWLFFLGTSVSVFVLRYKEPTQNRPYRVGLLGIPVLIFCMTAAFMLYSSMKYAITFKLTGFIVLFVLISLGVISFLLNAVKQGRS